jgi:hypothetical protein
MNDIEKLSNQPNYSRGLYAFIAIYKFTVEHELRELLNGEAANRIELHKFLGNIGRLISYTNADPSLTEVEIETCKDKGFEFNENGRIVGFETARSFNEYITTSIAIEYDEQGRISCISMCYDSSTTSMINVEYDEQSLSPKSFDIRFSLKNFKQEFIDQEKHLVLPADLDSQVDIFFDEPMSQEQMQAYNEYFLNNPTLNSELYVEPYYGGVIFDTAEAALEALVLYGEGRYTKRGEQSGLEKEKDAFKKETYDEDLLDEVTDTSTNAVTAFVNTYFRNIASIVPGEKYTFSFDYPDMEEFGFNNFFKSNVSIEKTHDGRYIVGVYFGGADSDRPEIQWANSMFQSRAFRGAHISYKFPNKDDVYFVGGLDRIDEAVRSLGFVPNIPLNQLITGEDIVFLNEYNSQYLRLSHQYVDGHDFLKRIRLKKEGFPFSIIVNLDLPRRHRVGVKYIPIEDKAKVEGFDNWDVTKDRILLRLPSHNLKAFEPYLSFRFAPDIEAATNMDLDPYSEEAALMIEQIKNDLMQKLMQD